MMLSPCLRARYPSTAFRSLSSRAFSQATRSCAAQRFSLHVSGKTQQQDVIDKVRSHCQSQANAAGESGSPASASAVILASREYASWLEDERFLSQFLQAVSDPETKNVKLSTSVNVLAGVVDGFRAKVTSDEPAKGFSVLYSDSHDLLPGLWTSESAELDRDRAASISYLSNSLLVNNHSAEVTLPLANTIFQNGRRSTLLASSWERASNGELTLSTIQERQNQKITAQQSLPGHITPFIPLLPLISPRKIVSGLGNIIRQVEVEGVASPASKELEALVPKIFETRAKSMADPATPMGVWAWVIPPQVVQSEKLSDLEVFPWSNQKAAADTVQRLSNLISSGCRLHRILSGGGGWGAKQGLLSLDPEISYSSPEQDGFEAFMKSFENRDSAEPSGGSISPGAYVLFCVQPHPEEVQLELLAPNGSSSAFGVAPKNEDEVFQQGPSEFQILDGQFGAVSESGAYIQTVPELMMEQGFKTKIDVPGAFIEVD